MVSQLLAGMHVESERLIAAGLGRPALVTSTVAEITGRPARTFRDWVADHAAELRT